MKFPFPLRVLRRQARQPLLAGIAVALCGIGPSASAAVFTGCGADQSNCVPIYGHVSNGVPSHPSATDRSSDFLFMGGGASLDGQYATGFGNLAESRGDWSAVFGHGARSMQGYSSVFGARANADGLGATAVGQDSFAHGDNAVAVGSGARTAEGPGTDRIAIGANAHAGGAGVTGAIALGGAARAENDSVAIGFEARSTASNAVALGRGAVASEDSSVSVGSATMRRRVVNVADARLGDNSSDAVTGRQLHATNQVLDSHAQVLVAHGQTLTVHSGLLQLHDRRIGDNRDDIDRLRADVDAFDPDLDGVVKFNADRSVIDASGARIQGVAAGDISTANGTDAVNGGQLFATNQRVQRIEAQGRFFRVGSDAFSTPAQAGAAGVAVGDGAQASLTHEGATAIGFSAKAYGKNSIALGRGSHVLEEAGNGFALGATSEVASEGGIALGAGSRVSKDAINGVAVGSGSIASDADTVSFGNNLLQRRLVNIAPGTAQGDATTVMQLGGALAALGGGAGIDSAGRVVAPDYTVQGGVHRNVGDALSALDGAVVTHGSRVQRIEQQLDSVFQGPPRLATGRAGQLDLAGSQGMVLGNLAAGRIAAGSRDAVNGGQLHEMRQQLDGRIDGLEQRIRTPDAQPRIVQQQTPEAAATPAQPAPSPSPDAPTESPQVASSSAAPPPPQPEPPASVDTRQLDELLERANRYTDQATAGIERRLDRMDRRFNRMAAMNTAQSAMAMNTAGLATYNRLGAGIGHAEGEAAMAVGYQRVLNERGSSTVSLHGAFTNSGERGVGLGLGIGW